MGDAVLAKRRSDAIDRQLKIDLNVYENTVKILLLGAGESGKSTIVKQMKIIHGDGYSHQQLESFTPVVYANLAESILRYGQTWDCIPKPYQPR